MSELTYLNRWKRYQIARLQGLIGGLKEEAGRLHGQNFRPAVEALGAAMMADLCDQCDEVSRRVRAGEIVKMPAFEFERL
jgi:hypothetical protein